MRGLAGADWRGVAALTLAVALPNSSAFAQTSEPCLMLSEAVASAVRADPRIGQADANLARANARIALERGADRPQVSAFGRSGLGDGVQADNEFDNRVGLRVSQRLYTFGRSRLAREAAEARAESARYGVKTERLDVAFEAAQRYLAIARGEERAAAATVVGGYFERAAAEAPRRLEQGLLKLSEASGVQAELARAQAQASEERLRADQERIALASLVGKPVGCVDSAQGAAFLAERQPAALEVSVAEAIERSPVLDRGEAELAAARLDQRREARSRHPDIGISGTSAFDYGRGGGGLEPVSRIGLDVTVPLYQGGQGSARNAAAAASAQILGFELATERRALTNDLTLAWSRVDQLGRISRLNRATLDAIMAQAAALERELDEGLVTLTEVIEAKRDENAARLAEIDTRYELLLERLKLTRLTGRLLDES